MATYVGAQRASFGEPSAAHFADKWSMTDVTVKMPNDLLSSRELSPSLLSAGSKHASVCCAIARHVQFGQMRNELGRRVKCRSAVGPVAYTRMLRLGGRCAIRIGWGRESHVVRVLVGVRMSVMDVGVRRVRRRPSRWDV